MRSWRDTARPIIVAAIKKAGDDPVLLKRLLFDAYPFGDRRYHPYKIWLDEIAKQTGRKHVPKRGRRPAIDTESMDLFKEES